MADIVIRNIDDAVMARLKRQAKERGVPVEREARRLLDEGTRVSRAEIAQRARAMRARQKPHQSRAVDIIREIRDKL